jgi:GT2 family glycosyltransferase
MNHEVLPFVSVILPTYQREAILCETIQQLLVQDYAHYELIVVDQTPTHEAKTEEFLGRNSHCFQYYKRDKPSLPAARNFGVDVAKGEIILFVDDDIRLGKNWIKRHVKNYVDPKIGGVAGRVIEQGGLIADGSNIGRVTRWGRVIGNHSSAIRTYVEWASGCNSSFRRELIIKAGKFDETFEGNAIFEDIDFSFRFRHLGYRILFDPDAVVWHLRAIQGGCQTRMENRVNSYYWFLRNKTAFFMKNFPFPYVPLLLTMNISRAIKVGLLETWRPSNFLYLLKASLDGYKSFRKGRRNSRH